ncbi:MAG: hypothetical protein ACP5TV_12205, partial [Anaerolineae bacterium]
PTNALTYEQMGRTEEAAQELAAARQLAEAVITALPTHPQALFQLGVVSWLSGEAEVAEAAFAQAGHCNASLLGERTRVEKRIERLRSR